MKHKTAHWPFFVLGLLVWFGINSCTKPTPFGSELLDDQVADYAFTDSLSIRCTVEPEDSVLTSDASSLAEFFLCGRLEDPLFGKSESEILTLLELEDFSPGFKNARFDSVVLYLRYNVNGVYGDTLQPQTLRVYRLDQAIDPDKSYYAHDNIDASTEIGAKENFLPRPRTTFTLFGDTSKTAARAPYLRIPLSTSFGEDLLTFDSLTYTEDSLFWDKLRGIKVTSSAAAAPGAMLAFDLNDRSFSFIRLYYTLNDTVHRSFNYFMRVNNKFTHFTHDYTGSAAEQTIGQVNPDKLFLQGMGGLRVRVEVPYAKNLDNIVVNKAELELTVASVPGDNPTLFTPSSQLIFTEEVADTTVVFSSDTQFGLGVSGGLPAYFGGTPEAQTDLGMNIKRYRLTLTQRFQDMVDDGSNLKDRVLYFNIHQQRFAPTRAIVYGPGGTSFPARLKLKYTRI